MPCVRFGWIAAILVLVSAAPSVCRAYTLSGHVTDAATGNPLAGASVSGMIILAPTFFNTTTDATGHYQVELTPGTYSVGASNPGYLPANSVLVDVSSGPAVADFALTQSASISGTVRVQGNGVAARINLYDVDKQALADWDYSLDDGTYTLTGFPAGRYAACVQDESDAYLDQCYATMDIGATGILEYTTLAVKGGDALTGIDFDLHPGSAITGTLHNSYLSMPIANAQVDLTLYSTAQALVSTIRSTTDANGQFSLNGVAPGSYYLEAGTPYVGPPNSYYVPALHAGGECLGGLPPCPFAGASQFDVPADGTASGIDVNLRPGHVITGKVSDVQSGLGIAGVTVQACEPAGISYVMTGVATTSADGGYALAHVIGSGNVYLYTSNSLGYVNIAWPDAPLYGTWYCPINGALTFSAPDQNLSNIDFSLPPGATISGTVTAADVPNVGLPAQVEVWEDDGNVLSLAWDGATDSSGNYVANGLSAGTYYAMSYFDNYAECRVYSGYSCTFTSGYGSVDPAQATAIVLTDGQLQGDIDFQLNVEIFQNNFE